MGTLIFAAWIASGALIFLPLGALLRLSRWLLRRFRRMEASPLELAPAHAAAEVQAAAPPRRWPPLPPWAMRLTQAGLALLLYAGFVVGAVYYTPDMMARALDTDYPMAAVTSGSMWPALKNGDLVILKGVDKAEDLNVGDIIAFRHEGGFAIHRIVSIEGERITTRGDANLQPDKPITFDDVVGRVLKIGGRTAKVPYLGDIAKIFGPALGTSTDDPAPQAPTAFEGAQDVEAAPPAEP